MLSFILLLVNYIPIKNTALYADFFSCATMLVRSHTGLCLNFLKPLVTDKFLYYSFSSKNLHISIVPLNIFVICRTFLFISPIPPQTSSLPLLFLWQLFLCRVSWLCSLSGLSISLLLGVEFRL